MSAVACLDLIGAPFVTISDRDNRWGICAGVRKRRVRKRGDNGCAANPA